MSNPSPAAPSVHLASLLLAALVMLVASPHASVAPPAPIDHDFMPIKLEVSQATQAGGTPLVAGRATFVRTTVRVTNPIATPIPIDGLLRVYVNGVETPESPYYSDNGPFPAITPNNPAIENGTLNFIFLAPASNNVVVEVEINPPGPNFAAETNTSNNVMATSTLNFQTRKVAELAYAPIDYRPSGGSIPNPPDATLIEPGMGDNFVQGIYPSSDWYYHRIDAPTKLWTSSLSGSGSSLLTSLSADIQLMSPQPDLLYGWVPGGLPYNGQSIIGGNVAMGNTEPIRYQRTIAHEIGHDFGLSHNSITTGLIGVDIERHLHFTQNLPLIKPDTLKDIMYAGLLTSEAWVWEPNYVFFFNHFIFDPPTDLGQSAGDAPALLVTGLWHTATGSLELRDVLVVPGGRLTAPAQPGAADLVVRTFAGGALLGELPITARGCDEGLGSQAPVVAFSAVLPAPGPGQAPIDRLVVAQAGVNLAQPVERSASSTAPVAQFVSPAGGALPGPRFELAWTASDADGDALTYYLRYSPDGATRYVPLATATNATSLEVDLRKLPALIAGRGVFELLASDGLRTTTVRTAPLGAQPGSPYGGAYGASVGGSAPWVEIVSPDTATSALKGANVILHSSGWDLEDRALNGASLQWSSNLDGALGQGRLLTTSTLSVGTHVITVTATDGDGMQDSDSASFTVVDRGLPSRGEFVCQADIGFGGPGASVLSVCGGDLSTGTTADLLLTGAQPLAPALLFASLSNNPTPFKGGLLVPLPVLLLQPLAADVFGEIAIGGIPGGNGPASLYLQIASADAGAPQGVGLSNVVWIDLLP